MGHSGGFGKLSTIVGRGEIELGAERDDAARVEIAHPAVIAELDPRYVDRLAGLLAPGGLYLLDSFVWFRIFHDYKRTWTRQRGGVRVHTRYRAEILDPVAQTYNEWLTFTVNDHGKELIIEGRVPAKLFFPQEFLCLVELSGRFEFIGWYNDFSFDAEVKPQGRHLVILRKR